MIANHYYHGRFARDVLLVFPFGEIFSKIHPNLSVLYIIKVYRLKDQTDLFKPNVIRPLLRGWFSEKLKRVLEDDSKKDNIYESNNFIMQRLKAQNFINASRIFFGLTVFAFFTGTLWFAIVN
mmetsp:Transcript_400/g.359  ORF Transcript_400/g.359 Transcript_400/m.359 type:complete len:123 (+) Transcript_400:2667-3035(+)